MTNVSLSGIKFRTFGGMSHPFPAGGPLLYSLFAYHDMDSGPFTGETKTHLALCTAGPGGEEFVKLDFNYEQGYPVWSHDYSKILFMRVDRAMLEADGDSGNWPNEDVLPPDIIPDKYALCVINVDGSGESVLKQDIFSHVHNFSPDGTKVAYCIADGNFDGGAEVHVCDIDGSNDVLVYTNGEDLGGGRSVQGQHIPTWSADGYLVRIITDTTFSGPPYVTTYHAIEIRKYDVTATDSYTVIYDILSDIVVANGHDSAPYTQYFTNPYFHVNDNNMLAFGYSVYRNDQGLSQDGYPTDIIDNDASGLYIIECITSSTPTFISDTDFPWHDWTMFRDRWPYPPTDWRTFVNSVVDDFNRANLASLGSNWTGPSGGIVSNHAEFVNAYWNPTNFGANDDCEAFVTLLNFPTNGVAMVKAKIDPSNTGNYYGVRLFNSTINQSNQQVGIVKSIGGSLTLFAAGLFLSVPATAPITIGIRVLGPFFSPDAPQEWDNPGGAMIIQAMVAAGPTTFLTSQIVDAGIGGAYYSSGYCGISGNSGFADVQLDNFGCGSITRGYVDHTESYVYQEGKMLVWSDDNDWVLSNKDFQISYGQYPTMHGMIGLNPSDLSIYKLFTPGGADYPSLSFPPGRLFTDYESLDPPFVEGDAISTPLRDNTFAEHYRYQNDPAHQDPGDPLPPFYFPVRNVDLIQGDGEGLYNKWIEEKIPNEPEWNDGDSDVSQWLPRPRAIQRFFPTGIAYPTWYGDEFLENNT